MSRRNNAARSPLSSSSPPTFEIAKREARRLAARGNELGDRVVVGKLYEPANGRQVWSWKILMMDRAVELDLGDGRRFVPETAYAPRSLGPGYAPNPVFGPENRRHNSGLSLENAREEGWMPTIGTLLAYLRALAHLELALHWQSRGPTYYADHLLFERLYKETQDEVDPLGERCVEAHDIGAVDPTEQLRVMAVALAAYTQGYSKHPKAAEMVDLAFSAEIDFMSVLRRTLETGQLTPGTENLLAGMADRHEGHTYLLQQRSGATDRG